ncbi:MAG: sulfatase/phosphatase domain-containing protein [Candidatus Promineifilaceae bacterium]
MLPEEYYSLQTTMDSNIWEGVLGFMENHYRNYCETLVGVDRELGRLLQELDDLGLSENTAIIYASDNGYSWGEHVITGKRWASEENMRIPFIVHYPGGVRGQDRRQSEMVLNIDYGPTILDLAGLPIPEHIQGSSIRPLLMEEEVPWRDSFIYEYVKDFPYNVPAHQALRTDQYLYVTYDTGREPGLYDIKNDPRTLNDIRNTDEGRRVEPSLRQRMEEQETSLI